MLESTSLFDEKQKEFAAYIREPDKNPVPEGVQPQRMEMYRELFFNNINSFLVSNFPVLNRVLDEGHWLSIAQDFFSAHCCKTPYFSEIPEEFLEYLQTERKADPRDPPYMLELAHYEWVEMALFIAKEEIAGADDSVSKNLLTAGVALSPLAWPLAYQYPVHRISPQFRPSEASATPNFLVAYRNSDLDVKFVEITPVTFTLLQILQDEGEMSARQCLEKVAAEFGRSFDDAFLDAGVGILEDLMEKNIIYLH